jgi:arsenical pump membrane protein
MSPVAGHALVWVISIVSIALMLVRPRGISEAVWMCAGASLLVLLRLLPVRAAGHAIAEGTDVYLFLAGMMLLAELAKFYGVFDWLAERAVERATMPAGVSENGPAASPPDGSAARLFTLIYVVGTAVTILMSNDATAVVLTPAVLAAVKRAKTRPLPCLFVCALVANAASFVLPISNPANLVVFHRGMPPLASWLSMFALPSAAAIIATYVLLRWRFRSDLQGRCAPPGLSAEKSPADRATLPRPGRITLCGIFAVVVVLLTTSALKKDLGLPTCVAAVVITGIVCLAERENPWRLAREISWSVIPLVAALFIVVEAIERTGARSALENALHAAAAWPVAWGSLAAGFAVGVGTNLVNNLPLGLLAGAALTGGHAQQAWSSAVMIGVDLGPNLSTTGSLATILWLIALRREGIEVSGWQFLKTGLLVMPPALILALCATLLARAF